MLSFNKVLGFVMFFMFLSGACVSPYGSEARYNNNRYNQHHLRHVGYNQAFGEGAAGHSISGVKILTQMRSMVATTKLGVYSGRPGYTVNMDGKFPRGANFVTFKIKI